MKIQFKAKGMHCTSCEELIKKTLEKKEGVISTKVDYPTETVEVEYDKTKTSKLELKRAVAEKGYITEQTPIEKTQNSGHYNINSKIIGIIFGIIGIIIVGYYLFALTDTIKIPEISANMGYGLLFLVGILTGFHCISMCGGFVVSYTAKDAQEGRKSYGSHLKYGIGKTVSYTIIGAGFGLLGSIITFTPMMRGIAGVIAGLFLVIFGLNMLNIFPWLRKIRIKTPSFLNKWVGQESKKHNSPLIIGLLNGLMIACGPLQAIYIMAAGTGSALEGAKILFMFAIGTLPVMMGFGLVASMVSKKATHNILKASGVIVIILGLIMVNRGLALTGTGYDTTSLLTSVTATDQITGETIAIENGYQIINMEVNKYGWEPDKFILKKDIPVKWIINGKEITGCNNAIQVPKLGLKFDIKQGKQTIEFTPTEEGVIPWSCWMGMIPGTFIIKENVDLSDTAAVEKELAAVPQQKAGSCGGSCGSAGCGGGTPQGCGCGG